MNNISGALRYLSNAFKQISKCLYDLFYYSVKGRPNFSISDYKWIWDYNLPVTNYHCSKCGANLLIKSHTQDFIVYLCPECGKYHKAYKNKVLGRF